MNHEETHNVSQVRGCGAASLQQCDERVALASISPTATTATARPGAIQTQHHNTILHYTNQKYTNFPRWIQQQTYQLLFKCILWKTSFINLIRIFSDIKINPINSLSLRL